MEVLSYGFLPTLEDFTQSINKRDEWPAEGYPMRLCSDDFTSVQAAVNQGIDSHLEAVNLEQDGGRILIKDIASMRTLLRRLIESDDQNSLDFASAVMQTLGFEWI